jgi:class 3 adenylate cyclase
VTPAWVPITNEAVRGAFPDASFYDLTGLEQVLAMARGRVPQPPLFRLTGIRITNASPGSATLTQPTSPWLQLAAGVIWPHPLIDLAMRMAARTGAPPHRYVRMPFANATYAAMPTMRNETLLAKAWIVSSGRTRITTAVDLEDTSGRKLAHAAGICYLTDDPAGFEGTGRGGATVEEPVYVTPDPPDRPLDDSVEIGRFDSARHRVVYEGRPAPAMRLFGIRQVDADIGRSTWSIPASPWLCATGAGPEPNVFVDPSVMAMHLFGVAATAVASTLDEGQHAFVNMFQYGGVRVARPDGRDIIAQARVIHHDADVCFADVEALDADGKRLGMGTLNASVITAASQRDEIDPERVLAAVLFTDIVSSTERMAEVGDSRWTEVFQSHLTLVRRQLQIFRGREVKTTGDGVLATFDSPALAVQCARAISEASRRADFEIRAGVHLGECEVVGSDISGIAVVVARRVCDGGSAGEILVTSTVREASAGSGLRFTDRGMHQLKGVPDEWRLFAVES